MRHEEESKQLAEKLVLMKNQIIENAVGSAMQKKFSAVKIGRLNRMPVFVRNCLIVVDMIFVYRLPLLRKGRITFQSL